MRADTLRRALLVGGVVALGAACSPETIQTTVGEGAFQFRSATLQVGDTMTVRAGVRYNDDTFVRDTFARFNVTPGAVATIGNVNGFLSGTAAGTATISATLRGGVVVDTTVTVIP